MKRFASFYAPLVVCAAVAAPASAADLEVSVYSGVQTAPHAPVSGSDPSRGGVGDFDFNVKWNGKSTETPPYYGFRAMWWQPSNIGWGVEFNHAKVYADEASLEGRGFSRLEFTDGLNLLTVNVMKRWPAQWAGAYTPYAGGGIGVAIPHVDVQTAGSTTFEYQMTGPALVLMAGVSRPLNDKIDIFAEYKGSYSQNSADLEGGGSLDVDIITNALNIGVTYKF